MVALPRLPLTQLWMVCVAVLAVVAGCRTPQSRDPAPQDQRAPAAEVAAVLTPEGPPPMPSRMAGPGQPRVVQYGPERTVDGSTHVFVRFSHPMQPVLEGTAAPSITLDPPVPGTMTWTDPYRLLLTLDRYLPPATRYEVTARGNLVTTAGQTLDLDRTWSFETRRPIPELRPVERGWYGDDDARRHWNTAFILDLREHEVPLTTLREHVHAKARAEGGEASQDLPITVRRPTRRDRDTFGLGEREYIIRPRGHWPAGRTVVVTVDAALKLGGPLPIGREVGSEIAIDEGLSAKLECFETYPDGCDPGPVRVRLNRPVPKRVVRQIEVTPRPKKLELELDDGYGYDGGDAIEIYGRFEPGRTYRIALGAGVRDVHGQPLAEAFDVQVAFVEPPPRVQLSSSRGTLVATDRRTVGLQTRWVRRVRLQMAVLHDQQLVDQFLRDPEDFRIPEDPRKVTEEVLDLKIEGPRGWSSQAIDLAAVAGGDRRPVLVQATAVEMMPEADGRPAPEVARGLFQQSDLGVVSVVSPSRSVARVARLSTAKAAKDVKVQLLRGTFDVPAKRLRILGLSDGLGIVDLPRSKRLPKRGLLLLHDAARDDRVVVRVGELHTAYRQNRWRYNATGDPYEDSERLLSELATERPLYRPGEKIHVVGWAAISTNHTMTGLRAPAAGGKVHLRLETSDGEVIDRRTVRMKPFGKYWGTLQIPAEVALDRYRLVAEIGDDTFELYVRVRDFRTPTFEVQAVPDRGDVIHGDDVQVRLAASYYFGGKVPIAKLRKGDRCSRTSYRPPGLKYPWQIAARPWREVRGTPYVRTVVSVDSLPEAAQGRADLTFGSDSLARNAPYSCTASVSIGDRSLEEVGAEAQWLVHPPRYLALRGPRSPRQKGDRAEMSVRTVDYTGARTKGTRVVLDVERKWWNKSKDGWTRQTEALPSCKLTTVARGDDASCKTAALREGQYIVTARFEDDEETPTARSIFWVGPRYRPRRYKLPSSLEVEVSPEKPKPGETVEIRIASPHKTGAGVVVLSHGGVRRIEPFEVDNGRAVVKVTADQSWVPSMRIDALMPEADGHPGMQAAHTEVSVTEHQRDLRVEVQAPTTAGPGDEIAIDVQVRAHDGDPTGGHVTLWAVDEAVLSLADAVVPELVDAFTIDRRPKVSIEHDYGSILYPYTPGPDPYRPGWDRYGTHGSGSGSGYGSGSGAGFGGRGRRAGPAPARSRFETTPIFIGDAKVPDTGKVTVHGTMPENLTTFRLTAIASSALPGDEVGGRFGHGEARTRVTVPVALRAITPRVLRPGDEAEIAALVDNLGGPAGTLQVELSLPEDGGQLRTRGKTTKTVAIAAGGQARVPFAITAVQTGEPKVQMRVRLSPDDGSVASLDDAMIVPLPVQRERALVRTSAVYGSLAADAPAAVQVQPPKSMVRGSGSLTVRVDGTLLAGLQDVAKYLVTYPYGCVEQTSSSMIPLIALGELARRYPLGVDDVPGHYRAGLARLQRMQTSSGGFGYWPDASRAHLYGSAYATWVLELAAEAGLDVPKRLRRQAREYLHEEVTRWASQEATTPHDDIPIAMALHALAYGEGKAPREAVDRMVGLADQLPMFARMLLAMALHRLDRQDPRAARLLGELEKSIDHSAGYATVRHEGGLFSQYFDSGARTSAIVLLALLQVDPDHAAVEPLARGLMRLRSRGRIRNTQENAYALLGLAAYARHYEAEAPDMTARVWVGDDMLLSPQISDDDDIFAEHHAEHPLPAADQARVTVAREGKGRLYYRVGMEWTPPDAGTKPIAAGLAVSTRLRGESGPVGIDDVIEPGTLLALDVTVTADTLVDYVAVDIPLPAGLEAVDPSIGKGRRAMTLTGSYGRGVTHAEVRRDRALVFADSLPPGKMVHTVYLRATSAGTFIMPPTTAASMYFPEIHGASTQRRVRVASPK